MKFSLPNLPYSYSSLEPYIDAKTMKIHHTKHHAGYTQKLNDALKELNLKYSSIESILENFSELPTSYRQTVRNNAGGYYNHKLFWKVMSPKDTKPSKKFNVAVENTFGGVEEFKSKFSDAAAEVFGSGWVWLITKKGKLEISKTSNQDNPVMKGSVPILTLDVWEHAYYLKYQNNRNEYIKSWWNVVNWESISRDYDSQT